MSSDIMVMAGLGRPFTLGMMYDARREKLIPGFSLFGDETLKQYASSNTQRSSEFQIAASDSIESKSSMMDIEASLGVSFLGGLVEVGGSAKYLNDTKKYQNQSRVTLKYKATTTYKQFTAPPGTVNVQQTAITDKGLATHVVTGILYGANAFFVFDSDKLEESNLQDIKGKMEAVIRKIPTISIEGSGSVKLTDEEKSLTRNLSCKFHGDFLLDSLPTTFEDAVKTYQKLPELLGEEGVDAVPMKVWLVPLNKFFSKAEQLVREITVGRVRKIHSTLKDLCQLKRRCNDVMNDKTVKQFPLIYDRVSNLQQILQDYTHTVKQKIAEKLPLIRGGTEDERSLEKITADRAKSPFSNENVNMWLDTIEREISALKACVGMIEETQTKCVSNQTELDREILNANVTHGVCFVFTSLGRSDPYLRVLSDSLESPNSESTEYIAASTDNLWCFSLGGNQNETKAQTFSELANNMKDSRNVRFFVAALANEKYQGASIYYYNEGSLVTDDFTFPRMPSVESLKDRRDLLWYACDLTFDPNTVNSMLTLSGNNKKVESGKQQRYCDHPERFNSLRQVLCKERLTGRHYWEVEWIGYVLAGVSYISIGRKGKVPGCVIGQSWSSWALDHVPRSGYRVRHNETKTDVTVSSPGFKRLGVYLDWRAGTLSYYMVTSKELHHIYTFKTKFYEPVFPAFCLGSDFDHGQVRLL
ncbi:neoverrucotoxin subunit alpha-like isoform X1 [Siniperca chuatsi]|uniref:neoverrucotoxin subunit alpha-like isoform X1 n=1 Tax=Siniperca chuatsi TaxID=119488 RepID=UPI001CE08BD1|nr:neoverrucotoxin subunit alpha-like isoform X1 [Siniperca chuatsi]